MLCLLPRPRIGPVKMTCCTIIDSIASQWVAHLAQVFKCCIPLQTVESCLQLTLLIECAHTSACKTAVIKCVLWVLYRATLHSGATGNLHDTHFARPRNFMISFEANILLQAASIYTLQQITLLDYWHTLTKKNQAEQQHIKIE